MYSYEIQQLLELKNKILTQAEFNSALDPKVSTQINTLIYNSWGRLLCSLDR